MTRFTGQQRILGLRQEATESTLVVTALLEDLRERGVRTDVPTLFVLDGAKALRSAVQRVWGEFAVVQRCQIHKRRNVEAHLPERHQDELRQRRNKAYHAQAVAPAALGAQRKPAWERLTEPTPFQRRTGQLPVGHQS